MSSPRHHWPHGSYHGYTHGHSPVVNAEFFRDLTDFCMRTKGHELVELSDATPAKPATERRAK